MSKLTKNNLQLFCRICLSALRPDVESIYNIFLVPNLTKLLIICTSLDINEDNDAYPKSLCQICYDKLQYFELFRRMAHESAEVLYTIVNNKEQSNFNPKGTDAILLRENSSKCYDNPTKTNINGYNKEQYVHNNDDDQLLLPELSEGLFFETCIKTEAIEIGCKEIQNDHTSATWCSNQVKVKDEVDINYDENSTYYEPTLDDSNEKMNVQNNFEFYDQNDDNHTFDNNSHESKTFQDLKQHYTDDIEMEHACQQCYKKFSSKYALVNHLKRHANFKEHVCEICGVAKITRTELQTHMRSHQPNAEKFKCYLCPQEFKYKNAIQRHVRAVHEGLRPYACSYCPKHFGTQSSRKSHERLHTGERPFTCEVCNRSFAQSECLRSHMKNHDKSLRTHVCKYCSQRFITRKNLIDHEERHRGDKPHICEICNRGFFKQEDLINHHKLHEDFNNSEISKYEITQQCLNQENKDFTEKCNVLDTKYQENTIMDRKPSSVFEMLNRNIDLENFKDMATSSNSYPGLECNDSRELYSNRYEKLSDRLTNMNQKIDSFAITNHTAKHRELELDPLASSSTSFNKTNQIENSNS